MRWRARDLSAVSLFLGRRHLHLRNAAGRSVLLQAVRRPNPGDGTTGNAWGRLGRHPGPPRMADIAPTRIAGKAIYLGQVEAADAETAIRRVDPDRGGARAGACDVALHRRRGLLGHGVLGVRRRLRPDPAAGARGVRLSSPRRPLP